MSNRNKVDVKIYGQEYTMVSCESREYMQKVANHVDDKMKEIAKKSKVLSTSMIAVLTSLNIADEVFKAKQKIEELENELIKPLKELEEAKSQLAASTSLLSAKDQEIREFEEMLEEEKQNTLESGTAFEQLLEEMERLKLELMEKNKELENVKKENEDLHNKVFDNQMKYVQARKELDNFIETFDTNKKIK
ncbi:MAG: cell division protein ZapA [Bacillota bacterium]